MPQVEPGKSGAPRVLVMIAAGVALVGLGLGTGLRLRAPSATPASSSTVVAPSPDVLIAVRDLARLESAEFHMERVIDLTETQKRFFDMVEAKDAILLVAVGDVTAGVDLAKLGPEDVRVDAVSKRVRITLPAAEILSHRLDGERTYVHSRTTDLLAARKDSLETRARQAAENSIVEAATQSGILDRAAKNAARTVEQLVHSLGYRDVQVEVRGATQ